MVRYRNVFRKTLNMDMLRAFFKISDEDTGRYFKDKDIWKCGEEYDSFFGFTGEEVHELLDRVLRCI